MKWTNANLLKFIFLSSYFFVFVCTPVLKVYGQTNTYSSMAQKILDDYNSSKAEDDDDLDIFKFSINNILNSEGDIVEKPAGNPSIFGRTDYGSEFFLENELSTRFSIEIPAFVIDDLAETESDDYFPVIRNGLSELEIDFKDLYDTENGEAITPEMGFVKLINEPTTYDLDDNLSNGEIVEFFVRPSGKYLITHNSENLFFIDRPIPEEPVISTVTNIGQTTNDTESVPSPAQQTTIYVGPGEEAIKLPTGEIKVYVTTVYVPAAASRFLPSQIVMPVKSDGTYIYDDEPRAAETFPDSQAVVAIPEQEAERLSKKVKEIKKGKETPKNPKHDEDAPPALDPGIEAMLRLKIILNEAQKGPSELISETRKSIKKQFPNMSLDLINFIINSANSDEKFDLIRDPKGFIDNELLKISNPLDLSLLLNADLSQKDLTKIYNLILYKFSSELADLGFEKIENQKFNFSHYIKNADQILEQVKLQNDLLNIAFLLRSDRGNQGLSNPIIRPNDVNPNSSSALFESRKSQKVLDQIKRFSQAIYYINRPSAIITKNDIFFGDSIPIVEVNVGVDERVADALKQKFEEDKRLNRNYQKRFLSSKLDQFNFELLPQDESSAPTSSPNLLPESKNFTNQELQLVAETTEATNNIINETITRMISELENNSANNGPIQLVSGINNEDSPPKEDQKMNETLIFSNALSTVQRLQEIEDIRAIFQLLGIGS